MKNNSEILEFIKENIGEDVFDGQKLYSRQGTFIIKMRPDNICIEECELSNGNNNQRNILAESEWYFPNYIEDKEDASNDKLDRWEIRAALEYELTRELFFQENLAKELFLAQLDEGVKKFHQFWDKIDPSFNNFGALSLLGSTSITSPKIYLAKHSYIKNDSFPIVPWFDLPELARYVYTSEYVQMSLSEKPAAMKALIDITWPDKEIQSCIKWHKEINSISEKSKRIASSEEGNFENYVYPDGQKGRGTWKSDLNQLGRYRLVNYFNSPTESMNHWVDSVGSKLLPNERSFNRNDLGQFYRETMRQHVSGSCFLSGITEIGRLFEEPEASND
jgi:hypothetical protein